MANISFGGPNGPNCILTDPTETTTRVMAIDSVGRITLNGEVYIPAATQTVGKSSSSSTYEDLACVGFCGMGSISNIKVIANKDAAVTNYDVRVLDLTSGTTIAEATGLMNETAQVIDMGTILNTPPNNAVLVVQCKKTGGISSDLVHVSAINIYK